MQTNSYTSSSNKKANVWFRVIIFIIILCTISYFVGEYFESIGKKNKAISNYKRTLEEFYKLEPNTLDLVFLGSSHSYCTFDPEIIDNKLGTNSFNMASPMQHADSSYFLLKETLKYHKPDTIVFEIYWDMIDDEFELKQAETILSAIDNENLKKEYIKEVFPLNEKIKYFFKPVRYQRDAFAYWNKDLTETVEEHMADKKPEEKTKQGIEYYKGKGFIYSDIIIPESKFYEDNQFIGLDGEQWDFDKTQKKYIEKLVNLCHSENIKIVFVTAPIANISMEHIKNYDSLHKKISDFARELEVPYRDYNIINKEKKLLTNSNFRDDAHLNYSGVEIIMKDFVDWIEDYIE